MEALRLEENAKRSDLIADKINSAMIMGLPVACLQISDVIQLMINDIENQTKPQYFALLSMHGIMEAQKDPKIFSALREAGLLLPDGMPLVWLSRLRGHHNMKRRVYGPELMMEFCRRTTTKYKHFLCGAAPGVADSLATKLKNQFGIQVTRSISPPYHELSDSELTQLANQINESKSDIVWIGISTPKQDLLMQRLRPLIHAPLMLGVGAAFDFNSDNKKMAPRWMQENGLEWLYRLLSEPQRLWYRYLVLGSKFLLLSMVELYEFKRHQKNSAGVSKRHP